MIRGGFVTLPVRDVAEAVRFYVETLGMKLVVQAPELTVIDAGEGFLVALRARARAGEATCTAVGPAGTSSPSTASESGCPAVTLTTKLPFDETVAILENRGVSFLETSAIGGGCASFRDPDGNLLHLRSASAIDPGSNSPA